jgi:HEAT repeat protein
MLKQEEITKRIEAARKVKPWLEDRMDRLAKLDKSTRSIGQLVLGYDEKGKRANEYQWNLGGLAVRCLKPLPESALLRLGEALFPRDIDAFKAAWALQARLPYQTGYIRKPFRAPNRPDLLMEARRSFLASLIQALQGIDEDLPWLAAHAAHIGGYVGEKEVGLLLAGAIDVGGKRGVEIEQILRDSASGLHETGQMGRHVTTAFLCSQKSDCWEFIEKLLLAAQRQEGLRQVVLESIDFSHPTAFRRMLRLIEDENLVRFSATVRAADVWLGMQLDSVSTKYVSETLRSIANFLDDEDARNAAISGEDAEKAFLGLWSSAFEDAPATVNEATKLLRHKKVENRFVATQILGMLALPESYEPLLSAVDDADHRVSVHAASLAFAQLKRDAQDDDAEETSSLAKEREAFGYVATMPIPKGSGDLFERLTRLYDRIPAKAENQKPLVWPWTKVGVSLPVIADQMVDALGDRPATRLLPFLDAMSPHQRARVAYLLSKLPRPDAAARRTIVRLVGDAAGDVRETAVKAMTRIKIVPDDLGTLEPLLDRKKSDLRRSVLNLILSLKDVDALASAVRLTASKGLPRRLAGLDLLGQMRDAGRAIDKGREIAEDYRASRPKLERDEQVYLDKLTQVEVAAITLDDALGLMNDASRTPPIHPKDRKVKLGTPAAMEVVKLFDDLIHKHREEPIAIKRYGGDSETQPLGSIHYGFRFPLHFEDGSAKVLPLEDLPLHQIWWDAWEKRPKSARDRDGLEAIRAVLMTMLMNEHRAPRRSGWRAELMERLVGKLPKARYLNVLDDIVQWVAFHKTDGNIADFVVDGLKRSWSRFLLANSRRRSRPPTTTGVKSINSETRLMTFRA